MRIPVLFFDSIMKAIIYVTGMSAILADTIAIALKGFSTAGAGETADRSPVFHVFVFDPPGNAACVGTEFLPLPHGVLGKRFGTMLTGCNLIREAFLLAGVLHASGAQTAAPAQGLDGIFRNAKAGRDF
jgi:hypothetical protein